MARRQVDADHAETSLDQRERVTTRASSDLERRSDRTVDAHEFDEPVPGGDPARIEGVILPSFLCVVVAGHLPLDHQHRAVICHHSTMDSAWGRARSPSRDDVEQSRTDDDPCPSGGPKTSIRFGNSDGAPITRPMILGADEVGPHRTVPT